MNMLAGFEVEVVDLTGITLMGLGNPLANLQKDMYSFSGTRQDGFLIQRRPEQNSVIR
jgi:hypothetical protein